MQPAAVPFMSAIPTLPSVPVPGPAPKEVDEVRAAVPVRAPTESTVLELGIRAAMTLAIVAVLAFLFLMDVQFLWRAR